MTLALMMLSAAIIIGLVGAMARIRSRQLDDQAVCRDEFFAAAERLITDPETPEKTVDEIDRLAHRLTSRTMMWAFMMRALMGKLRTSGSLRDEYSATPTYLRHDLVTAWVSAIYFLTFNNMLLGLLIRRLMLYSVPRRTDDLDAATPVGPMVDELARQGIHSAA